MQSNLKMFRSNKAICILAVLLVSCDLAHGQPVYETVQVAPLEAPGNEIYGNAVIFTDGNTSVIAACKNDTLGIDAGLVYLTVSNVTYELTALDGAAGDQFGYAIDAGPEQDSGFSRVVIGAPFRDEMGESSGAAYLFDPSGHQLVEYLPSDGQAGDRFGISVSLGSEVGNGVVAIGAMRDDGSEGAVYIFDMLSGTELMKIVPNGLTPFSEFGFSMEIDGSTLAVGAPGDATVGVSSGAVYVFDLETGEQLQRFFPSDGAAGDHFGHSVELASVSYLVVGSVDHQVNGVRSGAVYAFNNLNGDLENKFYPTDAVDGQQFGWSVSGVSFGLAVGAPGDSETGVEAGAVYTYYDPRGFSYREKLTLAGKNAHARYGHSVSMYGRHRLCVGAPDSNFRGPLAGYADTFDLFVSSTGQPLIPSDATGQYRYGLAVAVDDGLAVVGAQSFFENEVGTGGVAYIVDTQTGDELFRLVPDDVVEGDGFGDSVAIGDGFVAVSAPGDDENSIDSGSVYIYDASTGALLRKIVSPVARPPASTVGVLFGQRVEIDNGILVVGAQNAKNGEFSLSGLVFLYDLNTGTLLHQLEPTSSFSGQRFGINLAIGDGVVGVVSIDNMSSGGGGSETFEIHFFDQTTGALITKLNSQDIRVPSGLGFGLSIDGGAIAMSSSGESKYVYDLQAFGLLQEFSIPNAVGESVFNRNISLDGDILYVTQLAVYSTLDSDSVYMFNITNGESMASLERSDSDAGEGGVNSLAVSNGLVVVGSAFHNSYGGSGGTGAVYIYDVNEITCPADLTGDRVVNFFDVSAFLAAFSTGDPSGDFNNDGAYNFFDVSDFLMAYSASCF